MSAPDAVVSARQNIGPVVRDAVPADYPAICDVVTAACRQYADLIAPDIFSAYLANLLDLDRHEAGTPVLAFHPVSFMTGAIAPYERLGYCRAPEFDYDWAAGHNRSAAMPIMAVAFLHHLTPMHACA